MASIEDGSRRALLKGILLALLPLGLRWSPSSALALQSDEAPSFDDQVRYILRHHESAQRIGRVYLECHQQTIDPAALLRSYADLLPLEATPYQLSCLVSRRIRDDCATRSTVFVQGWLLTKTDAELCGVFSLTEKRTT